MTFSKNICHLPEREGVGAYGAVTKRISSDYVLKEELHLEEIPPDLVHEPDIIHGIIDTGVQIETSFFLLLMKIFL